MILKPGERTLEALAHLEHNHHWQSVREWLEQSLHSTQSQCVRERDADELRRAQGAGIDLAEILSVANGARELIRQARSNQR